MILRSVGVLSAGKVMGAVMAVIGLILGGFAALMSMAGLALQGAQGGGGELPAVFFGVAAVIFVPMLYGVLGFILGVIYAALYNLIAGFIGGLELEFERGPQMYGPQ